MRRLLLGLATVLALPCAAADAAAGDKRGYVVTLEKSVGDSSRAIADLRGKGGFETRFRYAHAVKGFAADLDASQVRRLERDARVDFVERDITFTAGHPVTTAPGEETPFGVRRIGAATATAAHAASTTSVAVLDTGIDLRNPDLNAVDGVNCVRPGKPAQDDNGHGTNVAGIIGARNQGEGVIGVAPGTRLHAVKVLDKRSSGTLSQLLCGIDWVTANAKALGIGVVNMSVGATGADGGDCGSAGDAGHRAICRSTATGVTYVAAAGNAGRDFSTTVPAAYPEVLTATAMTDTDGSPEARGPVPACLGGEADDTHATFSNFGSGAAAAAHTVAAPGTCVTSTGLRRPSTYYGTSQAAPHVTGTVALCHGSGGIAGPCAGLSPSAVIERIVRDASSRATLAGGFSGDPLRPFDGRVYGPLVAAGAY